MVAAMGRAYGESLLAMSYDPEEKARGVTALRSEWELLKKQLNQPSSEGGSGSQVVEDSLASAEDSLAEMSLEEVPHARISRGLPSQPSFKDSARESPEPPSSPVPPAPPPAPAPPAPAMAMERQASTPLQAVQRGIQQAAAATQLQAAHRGNMARSEARIMARERSDEDKKIIEEALAAADDEMDEPADSSSSAQEMQQDRVRASQQGGGPSEDDYKTPAKGGAAFGMPRPSKTEGAPQAVQAIQGAWRSKVEEVKEQKTLEATSSAKKKSKTWGWLLGFQSKELRLEETALVYTKGNGKKPHRLPYSAIQDCVNATSVGPNVWRVEMSDGHSFEFHAPSATARDTWTRAVMQRVNAYKESGGAKRFQETAVEAQASSSNKGGKTASRTISFSRGAKKDKTPAAKSPKKSKKTGWEDDE